MKFQLNGERLRPGELRESVQADSFELLVAGTGLWSKSIHTDNA